MKFKLLILSIILAGSFAINSASAQVHVDVNFQTSYPGYTYYTYPAWRGHYRDHVYYQHYHRRFERQHRAYFQDRQHFDNNRFEKERHWHDGRENRNDRNENRNDRNERRN